MTPPRIGLAIVWLFTIACFFVGGDAAWAVAGRAVFWIMAAVHVIECIVFLPRMRAAGGSLPNHLLQTFIFGFLHASELPKPGADGGASAG
jgi:uncharacterized protein YhhL (DUF1145 family)